MNSNPRRGSEGCPAADSAPSFLFCHLDHDAYLMLMARSLPKLKDSFAFLFTPVPFKDDPGRPIAIR